MWVLISYSLAFDRHYKDKMLEFSYVDIEKSILKGKIILAFKKPWHDYIEPIFVGFFLLSFSFGQFMFALDCIKYHDLPDKVFTLILFITSAVTLYGVYRKLSENKLNTIKHSLNKGKIEMLILRQFQDINKKNIIKNGDCIVIKKEFSYYYKIYTLINLDNVLYYNILNFYPRVNPPVIFDHLLLKRDLQKLIDNSINNNP